MSRNGSACRRSRYVVASLLAMSAALWASSVRADVLKVVPSEALGVLKVRNIGQASTKVADLSARLGIAAFVPDFADPLGSLKEKGGIAQGVKDDGEFGVVLLPAAAWPTEETEDSQPAIVLLMPVTDYATFLGNFENPKTENGVSEVLFGGETSFIAQWGEYAAITPGKAYASMQGTGVQLSPHAAKEAAGKDAVLWANIPAMKAVFGPELEKNRQTILEQVGEALAEDPGSVKYADVAKAAVSQALNAAESFLRDAQSATVSFNLTDAGINTSVAAEFSPSSYLGGWVASVKGQGGSFTMGLPAGPYLMFGGFSGNGEALSKLVTDLAGPVVAELKKVDGGEDAAKIMTAVDTILQAAQLTNFGFLAPRAALGTESLMQVAYFIKADSAKYMAAMREYSESYSRLMSAFEGTTVNPFVLQFKPANRTVDGVTFDTLAMGFNPNPKTPEEAMMQQMMQMMYGPAGLSYDIGAVDAGTLVMGMGMTDANLSKLIAAAKGGNDSLGGLAHVKRTAAELPSQPAGVFYIALDEFIRTGTSYARQFGIPVNLQLPEGLQPIGVALATDGSVLKVDSHIPTDLLQSIIAAAIQMQMQMGGGM